MHRKNSIALCLTMLAVTSCGAVLCAAMQRGLGYSDTAVIPGTNWHVHDGERPQPRIVAPGATFSHNAPAPADAVVLFDGKDLSKWQSPNGQAAAWRVDSAGFMETGRGSVRTRDRFADFQLHLEFATSSQVSGEGQGRGNPLRYRNIWVRPLGEYDKPLPSESSLQLPESRASAPESVAAKPIQHARTEVAGRKETL